MKPVLCIPSYSRPDGKALERCKDLPLEKFLFIRKSQKDMYKHWSKYYNLVLQTGGTDLGIVRNNIIRYCHEKGYEWAFMLDDDISKVESLGKKEDGTITAQRIIDGIPGPRMELGAFKKWFACAKEHNLALSAPNHRAYDRFNHGELRVNKAACIQCLLVHVPDIIAVGNYQSVHLIGTEDYYIHYKLMSAGFKIGKVGLIEYDCPAVGEGKGGCNAEEYIDINGAYERYVKSFLDNVCDDKNLISTKTTSRGQKSIQFVWKNWGGYSLPLELD